MSGGSPGSAIRIPVGTDGYSLIADQFSTGGVRWADAAGAGTKQGDLEAAVKSSVTFQGLTFEAVTPGVDGNNITIQLIELQPVTGVVFQTTGTDILIKTQNAVTTVNQGDILTGFGSAPTDVTDLINLTITSSGTLLTGVQAQTPLTGGVGALIYSIKASLNYDPDANPLVIPNIRGEWSTDLQTSRLLATQVASGVESAILGGKNNTAAGVTSTIVGGESNDITGDVGVVVGGNSNNAAGLRGVIVGGYDNDALNNDCVTVGGYQNKTAQNYATVVGGLGNYPNAQYATVVGGNNNDTTSTNATYSVMVGGNTNKISATDGTIVGGESNVVSGDQAAVVGGFQQNAAGAPKRYRWWI